MVEAGETAGRLGRWGGKPTVRRWGVQGLGGWGEQRASMKGEEGGGVRGTSGGCSMAEGEGRPRDWVVGSCNNNNEDVYDI